MTAKWTAVGSEKTTAVWVKDENGKTVCNVARCDDDWNRASLIAAAPDLLQALEFVAEEFNGKETWLADKVRAAIAKAKGE